MGCNQRFSLDSFKKWMSETDSQSHSMKRPEEEGHSPVGKMVESKIGFNKLLSKMSAKSSNLEEMALEFKESGGRIVDVEGKDFLIEVSSGCFNIHRIFVKKSTQNA
jgi:hypothetical protein